MKKPNGIRRLSPRERWRLKVKRMYNFACYFCGKTNDLQAHHILSKHKYPEFARDIFNGICVCSEHHKILDRNNY